MVSKANRVAEQPAATCRAAECLHGIHPAKLARGVPRLATTSVLAPSAAPCPAGSDELLEQLAAEQLAALATAALEGPGEANHSGGSTTAGQAAGALQDMQLGAGLLALQQQEQPRRQLEQSPQQQLDAFRAALAVAAADRQGGGAGAAAAGQAAASGGPPAPPAEGPGWAAEATAGAIVGLGRIDLPTSVLLMQQAAQVIRGLHEELQRSKNQARRGQGGVEACCVPSAAVGSASALRFARPSIMMFSARGLEPQPSLPPPLPPCHSGV